MEVFSFRKAVETFGGTVVAEWKVIPERMVYGYLADVAEAMSRGMWVEDRKELRSRMEKKLLECGDRVLEDLSGAVLWRVEEKTPRYYIKLKLVLIQLALQVGTALKYRVLAKKVGLDHKTVRFYVEFLVRREVVFCLKQEEEGREGFRVYFYDCGLRNALIGDFRPLEARQDVQGLWENFVIAERMKKVKWKGRGRERVVRFYRAGDDALCLVEKWGGREREREKEKEMRVEWRGDDMGLRVDLKVVCWQNVLRFI